MIFTVANIQKCGFWWIDNTMHLETPSNQGKGQYFPGGSILVAGHLDLHKHMIGWIGPGTFTICKLCTKMQTTISCQDCKEKFCWEHIMYDNESHEREWYHIAYPASTNVKVYYCR